MLDRVIDRLRADPAIPRPRTLEQWTLFFADVRTAAEDDLTQKLEGFARARDVIEALADVLHARNRRCPRLKTLLTEQAR